MAQEALTSRDDEELLDDSDKVEYAESFDDSARLVGSGEPLDPIAAQAVAFHGDSDDALAPEEESDEVAEARARVEETRAHITETLDALSHKLSPATLIEEAKEATIHKAQETVTEVVDAVKEKAGDVVDLVKEKTSGIADAVGGAYHAAVDHVTEAAHHVADAVTGAAHSASDAVTGAAHNVADRVNDFREDHTTPRVPDSTSRYDLKTVGSVSKPSLGATIVESIKLNPVPAAIAGFGIGWLLLSAQRQHSSAVSAPASVDPDNIYISPAGTYASNFGTASNVGAPTDTPGLRDKAADLAHNLGDQASDLAKGVSDKASSAAHALTEKASGIAQGVSDKASGIAHGVSDKASGIAQGVSEKASDLKDRATDWAGTVRDSAGHLRDKAGDTVHNLGVQTKQQAGATVDYVGNFIQEQPLAAAAIALLLGAVVAYSLPSTQKENEVLGPPRDRLVDQGKDAVQDVAHKVQSVATTALGQAQQSLSQTVDQAKEQFQQTVQETKDTVVSEAKNQGLAGANAA